MTVRLAPDLATSRRLADVSRGEAAADTVLTGGSLVNVFTEELLAGWGVAIRDGRVAFVGPDEDVRARVGERTETIDLDGDLAAPGLVEGHTHLTRSRVSDMVDRQVALGVTTTIVELQEPSFILGARGAKALLDEATGVGGRLFYTVPGLISVDPDQDQALDPEDWIPLLDHPHAAGVCETYWGDLLRGHPRTEALAAAALERGLPVEGHGAGARPGALNAMTAMGIGSDHEGVDAADVLARLRLGLIALARHGATRQDIQSIAPVWRGSGVSLARLGLVTDGVEPVSLDRGESLNWVVEQAVELGVPLPAAVRMAGLTVAEHFGLGRWLGGLGPGMLADVAVLARGGGFRPRLVLVGGRRPAPSPPSTYPGWMLDTCRMRGLRPELLGRPRPGRYRAMEVQPGAPLVTREVEVDGRSELVCTVADRAGGERAFRGLLRGFGAAGGGVAISSAWECPGTLLVGDRAADLALAADRVQALHGGVVVVAGGRVLAEFAAPVAGLYSSGPFDRVVADVEGCNRALQDLGCPMPNPILTLETLTSAAIPFLRIWAGGYRRLRDGSVAGLDWD